MKSETLSSSEAGREGRPSRSTSSSRAFLAALEAELTARKLPVKYGVNVYNPNGVPFWVDKGALPREQRLDSDFDLVGHAEQLR